MNIDELVITPKVDDFVKSYITHKWVPEGAQILRNEAYL